MKLLFQSDSAVRVFDVGCLSVCVTDAPLCSTQFSRKSLFEITLWMSSSSNSGSAYLLSEAVYTTTCNTSRTFHIGQSHSIK